MLLVEVLDEFDRARPAAFGVRGHGADQGGTGSKADHVLLHSGTASATNFSFSLAQNENAEITAYRGVVKGIWAGDGSGAALLTELY